MYETIHIKQSSLLKIFEATRINKPIPSIIFPALISVITYDFSDTKGVFI